MSFTDQQPFVVTEADLTRPWNGKRDGSRFRCYLCLRKFVPGDVARWQYANGTKGQSFGNFFTCAACDGPDVLDRWRAIMEPFWERYKALGYDNE